MTSLLRHAVEQQLREASDLGCVQFRLPARLGDSPTGSHRMTDGVVQVSQELSARGLRVGQLGRSPAARSAYRRSA
ncbi:hypothetical protein OHS58_09505 [Amycolatopsis sp. NBC_00348]|uniref:hypothetical protein n=1 Tax=Amycolatopsis sp. NBC_00348 TaxID=2975956 RepID=UPI002E2653E4